LSLPIEITTTRIGTQIHGSRIAGCLPPDATQHEV
jgi:hypothetical protein